MGKRLVQGVGVNDADYKVSLYRYVDGKQKQQCVWRCHFYRTWCHMLERGYSAALKAKYPTYEGAYSCDEWHLFSGFKGWMEQQPWEGNELDKDLLFPGNKVYSPETCVFVSGTVNKFITDSGSSRGQYMIGVSWCNLTSKFKVQCCNPFTKSGEYLGLFDTEIEGHEVWLRRKLQLAHELASIQTDTRVADALIHRYENYNTLNAVK